jgi:MurNAc alpha-1-phosphate uridylyltransferase
MTQVTRAMVMAAGMGSRMRPLTDTRPKPLIDVDGRALIDRTLDRLAAAGVREVVINLHYKAQMLRDHLVGRRDVHILWSDETDALLDTGGGVVRALPLLSDGPFFVLNSDSIWTEDGAPALTAMMDAWDEDATDALLLLARRGGAIGFDGRGDFLMDAQSRLARVPQGQTSPYAYMGTQIAHPRLFADAPQGAFSTNLMWNRAIAAGRLKGMVLNGTWLHVGTPQARDEAEVFLQRQRA